MASYFIKTIRIDGKTTVGKNVLGKYKHEDGCFSIMRECDGNSYFAFSGAREYKDSSMKEHFDVLARDVMQKVFDVNVKIEDLNADRRWKQKVSEHLRYVKILRSGKKHKDMN